MAKSIKKCVVCETYTMLDTCPSCKGKTYVAKPAKYSPQDKYGEYRRKAKEELTQQNTSSK